MAAVTQSNDGNKAMPDEDMSDERDEASKAEAQSPSGPKALNYKGPTPTRGNNFFTIYKKGQGYWTRMGTAIGAGALGLMIAFELYYKIPTFLPGSDDIRNHRIALIASAVFLAVYSAVAYWFTNKPDTVDFLIATDSEMKKVNWTTRRELIGSTKIVVLFMFMIAIYLFACDLLFGGFFQLIGVLKTWF